MSRFAFLSDMLGAVFARGSSVETEQDSRPLADLCRDLLSAHGELTLQHLATALLQRYAAADTPERLDFFKLLARDYDVDGQAVLQAAKSFAETGSVADLASLQHCVEPQRQALFRILNRAPGATNRLVRMRADLIEMMGEHPELERIDLDFQHLFRSWFNRGFLVLREIDWHTPANILEKIIRYEAVHEISSWKALRSRLEPVDRRCFAFFHPAMLDEPLIFVEVALTRSGPGAIREVLSTTRTPLAEDEAETAVFYSISNCQPGLKGVSFGNFLIKQVATELAVQCPNIKTFRTLSPIPGLMRWINAELAARGEQSIVEPGATEDQDDLGQWLPTMRLARRIANSERTHFSDEQRRELSRLVTFYLARVKRDNGEVYDPVARFHLGNGAILDQVLPGADVYQKGLSQAAGAMVSYRYDMSTVDLNHERYARDRHVALSAELAALLGNS